MTPVAAAHRERPYFEVSWCGWELQPGAVGVAPLLDEEQDVLSESTSRQGLPGSHREFNPDIVRFRAAVNGVREPGAKVERGSDRLAERYPGLLQAHARR